MVFRSLRAAARIPLETYSRSHCNNKNTLIVIISRVLVLYQFPQTAIPVTNSVLYFLMLCRRTPFCLRYICSFYHPCNVPGSHKIEGYVYFLFYFSNISNIEMGK